MRYLCVSLLLLLLFTACTRPTASTLSTSLSAAQRDSCDAAEFGAVPDDGLDDRVAIQAALIACREVHLGAGRYLASRAGAAYYAIALNDGSRLIGAGIGVTTIAQPPGTAPSVRLLQVVGRAARVADLSLDGDRAHQTADEHRAGIFTNGPMFIAERVEAHDFTGDGLYIYTLGTDARFDAVTSHDNDRDGIVLNGSGAILIGSTITRNARQQVDSEPVSVTDNDVTVVDNTIDAQGVSGDYAVTISGSSAADVGRSRGWYVGHNRIGGGVFVVWAQGAVVEGNTITNPTTKPCVSVYRRSIDVIVASNTCTASQLSADNVSGYLALGAGAAEMPSGVRFWNNSFTVSSTRAKWFGVRAEGVTDVEITGNTLRGPGIPATFYAGVYLRSTVVGSDLVRAIIKHNDIAGFGDAAFRLAGNTTPTGNAAIDYVELGGNTISPLGSQTRGLVVDTNVVLQLLQVRDNTCGGAACETMGL